MPSRKSSTQKPATLEMPPWPVILEEMRSQNRATIEAVEASRLALEQRIDRIDQEWRGRDVVLELAIRELKSAVEQNTADIHQNTASLHQNTASIEQNTASIQQNTTDIRQLQGDVRQNTTDIIQLQGDVRNLSAKIDALARIEERVSAIEKQIA